MNRSAQAKHSRRIGRIKRMMQDQTRLDLSNPLICLEGRPTALVVRGKSVKFPAMEITPDTE